MNDAVDIFLELLSNPDVLVFSGVSVALLLVWKVFMPLLRPKRMSIRTRVEVQGGNTSNTDWTPEDQKKYERIERGMAIRSSAVRSLVLVGLLALMVWVFAPDDTIEFIVKFWQPGTLFLLGITGWVVAVRRLNTYNSWSDIPYVLSFALGLGAPVLGVVQLLRVLS